MWFTVIQSTFSILNVPKNHVDNFGNRRMSRRPSNELVPIPEHTSIDLTLASPRPRLSSSSSLTPEDFDACAEEEAQTVPNPSIAKMSRSACVNVNDAKWHTLSL